jgi:hypothetical protein
MDNSSDSSLQSDAFAPVKRPVFLTVLCILTWVMCGFTFISTCKQVFFKPSMEEQLAEVDKLRSIKPEIADQMEEYIENQTREMELMQTGITLVAVGFSAFGAMMMWQLRRRGFYLYLVGEFVPYLAFLFDGGRSMKMMGAMLGPSGGYIMLGVMLLFDAIFVALYAVNLKHLKQ